MPPPTSTGRAPSGGGPEADPERPDQGEAVVGREPRQALGARTDRLEQEAE